MISLAGLSDIFSRMADPSSSSAAGTVKAIAVMTEIAV